MMPFLLALHKTRYLSKVGGVSIPPGMMRKVMRTSKRISEFLVFDAVKEIYNILEKITDMAREQIA